MQLLRAYLDDRDSYPCGICDNCTGENLDRTFDSSSVQQAVDFLRKSERIIEPRKLFPDYKKIADEHRLEEGRVLSRWGDGGWGGLVRTGKQHDGRFSDQLVSAACELIRDRWKPDPIPEWVTYVPSLCHPELVSDFTSRLARSLGLDCMDVVIKVRATQPQKTMQNSQQQYDNVQGAFKIRGGRVSDNKTNGELPSGAVLLVDDMVDSRWTLTVVGLLLRQAGSGPVFPFALADTAGRSGR